MGERGERRHAKRTLEVKRMMDRQQHAQRKWRERHEKHQQQIAAREAARQEKINAKIEKGKAKNQPKQVRLGRRGKR